MTTAILLKTGSSLSGKVILLFIVEFRRPQPVDYCVATDHFERLPGRDILLDHGVGDDAAGCELVSTRIAPRESLEGWIAWRAKATTGPDQLLKLHAAPSIHGVPTSAGPRHRRDSTRRSRPRGHLSSWTASRSTTPGALHTRVRLRFAPRPAAPKGALRAGCFPARRTSW